MSNVINHSDLVTIINDSMIDLDKLRAINKYVVDNGEYNYDSLATYGIEVKKYGVCMSYTYIFDYLATNPD